MTRSAALALARLRARPGRTAVAAAAILAASAMAGAAITVSLALTTGFDRAADRADLPDVIARFDARTPAFVQRRVGALAGVDARSYRFEINDVPLRAPDGARTRQGSIEVLVAGARRGYAVVAGRDVRQDRGGETVVERGVANRLGLHVGDPLPVGRLDLRVVGIAVG